MEPEGRQDYLFEDGSDPVAAVGVQELVTHDRSPQLGVEGLQFEGQQHDRPAHAESYRLSNASMPPDFGARCEATLQRSDLLIERHRFAFAVEAAQLHQAGNEPCAAQQRARDQDDRHQCSDVARIGAPDPGDLRGDRPIERTTRSVAVMRSTSMIREGISGSARQAATTTRQYVNRRRGVSRTTAEAPAPAPTTRRI